MSKDESCLKYHKNRLNFWSASEQCRRDGGLLWGIENNNNFLSNFKDIFIGTESFENSLIWVNLKVQSNHVYKMSLHPVYFGKVGEEINKGVYPDFDSQIYCPIINGSLIHEREPLIRYSKNYCRLKMNFFCEKPIITLKLLPRSRFCDRHWFYSQTLNRCFQVQSDKQTFPIAELQCSTLNARVPKSNSNFYNKVLHRVTLFKATIENCGLNSPCKNGGYCVNLANSRPICRCTPGYSGNQCERAIMNFNPCYSRPCGPKGVCYQIDNRSSGYLCKCEKSFSLSRCPENGCVNTSLCLPNGYCESFYPNTYRCRCKEGFTGINCNFRSQLPNQAPAQDSNYLTCPVCSTPASCNSSLSFQNYCVSNKNITYLKKNILLINLIVV